MKRHKAIEVRKCKRWGCEVASDTKGDYCVNCKRKLGIKIKTIGGAIVRVAGVVISVITLGRK